MKMKESALVSIIVPVYNIENYIEKCLESIKEQTFSNLEVLVIDDGSTDQSGVICDEFAEKDDRFIIIHKSNAGLVSARKKGLELAHGEYCLHIDGDDWIEPRMVECLLRRAERDQSDLVQSGFITSRGQKTCYDDFFLDEISESARTDILQQWLEQKPFLGSQMVTKIYKTSFIKKCYMFVPDEHSYGEDYLAYLFVLKNAVKISSVPDIFYHYTLREDSLSHKYRSIEKLFKVDLFLMELYGKLVEFFPLCDKELIEESLLRINIFGVQQFIEATGNHLQYYLYPDIDHIRGKKIVIYGAGKMGRDFYLQISSYEDINIVSWVDKNYEHCSYDFCRVNPIDSINEDSFDFVIIAIKDKKEAYTAAKELHLRLGVDEEVILWDYMRKDICTF